MYGKAHEPTTKRRISMRSVWELSALLFSNLVTDAGMFCPRLDAPLTYALDAANFLDFPAIIRRGDWGVVKMILPLAVKGGIQPREFGQ